MKLFTIDDVKALALGSALLGSGGGGDPTYAALMLKHQLITHGPISLISVDELSRQDLVMPLGIIGAPLVNGERLTTSRELQALITTLQQRLQKKATVLMPGEIGGANAFAPLLIAAKNQLPVLDADLIGRAFPELPMNTAHLRGYPATPALIADGRGNTAIIEAIDTPTVEHIARHLAISMGSSAAIALHLMAGPDVSGAVVPKSISRALQLGHLLINAGATHVDPVSQLIEQGLAQELARGTLIDIEQEICQGFLQGSAVILAGHQKIQVSYQNEYLLAMQGDHPLCTTPDIIALIDETSGTPLTSDNLKYGLQVALVALPAPPIWTTEAGLALVGPSAFGYSISYQPLEISCNTSLA